MSAWSLGTAFTGGLLLGLGNFSLLRATTVRLLEARRPVFLAMGSFFGRATVMTVCIYLLAGGHGDKMAAAFAGLLLARGIILRRTACGQGAAPALARR